MTAFNIVLWLFLFGAKRTTETTITALSPASLKQQQRQQPTAAVAVSLTSSSRYEKVRVLLLMQYVCFFVLFTARQSSRCCEFRRDVWNSRKGMQWKLSWLTPLNDVFHIRLETRLITLVPYPSYTRFCLKKLLLVKWTNSSESYNQRHVFSTMSLSLPAIQINGVQTYFGRGKRNVRTTFDSDCRPLILLNNVSSNSWFRTADCHLQPYTVKRHHISDSHEKKNPWKISRVILRETTLEKLLYCP